MRFASIRVLLGGSLGWLLAFPVPGWLGIPPNLGLVGLTLASGMAAWMEYTLLRFVMNRRIGKTEISAAYLARLWGAAAVAAAAGSLVKLLAGGWPPLISGGLVLAVFGILYFTITALAGVPEARNLFSAFPGRRK
jgi:putative peptidoglycan lipid II flippase